MAWQRRHYQDQFPDTAQQEGATGLIQEGGDCIAGRCPGGGNLTAGIQLADILLRGDIHGHIDPSLLTGAHHSHERTNRH
jgi:hypothetical protein